MAARYASEIEGLCSSEIVGGVSAFLKTGKTDAERMKYSLNLIAERGDLKAMNGMYAELMELIVADDNILQVLCAKLAQKKEIEQKVTYMLIECAENSDVKGFAMLVDPSKEENLHASVLDFVEDIMTRDLDQLMDSGKQKTLDGVIGIKNSIEIEKKAADAEANKASVMKSGMGDEIDRLRKELAVMKKAMEAKTAPAAPTKPIVPDLTLDLDAGGVPAATAVANVAAALGIVPKVKKGRGPNKPKADAPVKAPAVPRKRKQATPKKVNAVPTPKKVDAVPTHTAPVMSPAAAAMMHDSPMMQGRIPVMMSGGMIMMLTPEEIKSMTPATPPY